MVDTSPPYSSPNHDTNPSVKPPTFDVVKTHNLQTIFESIRRVYLSDQPFVELLMTALLARAHVLLEGVPGVAKTTLASCFATVCGCQIKRVQFTPDLLPSDIVGGSVFNMKTQEFNIRKGPIFTHILLGDELNRAPAKTQSALLEAMQETQVTLEGQSFKLPLPFFTIATQNPIEQVGVYALPEAQLDRFAFKLNLDYPSVSQELEMLTTYQNDPPSLDPLLTPEQILEYQNQVDQIYVHQDLKEYIVHFAQATRQDSRLQQGMSPRASLIWMKLSKAYAFINQRNHVIPDDLFFLAPYVISHRLKLHPETLFEGGKADDIVKSLLKKIVYQGYNPVHL